MALDAPAEVGVQAHSIRCPRCDEKCAAHWRVNSSAAGYPDEEIQKADITDLYFDDASFQTTSSQLLGPRAHLQMPHKAITELHRVLKPGGRLITVMPNVIGTFSLINDRNWRKPHKIRYGGNVVRERSREPAPSAHVGEEAFDEL